MHVSLAASFRRSTGPCLSVNAPSAEGIRDPTPCRRGPPVRSWVVQHRIKLLAVWIIRGALYSVAAIDADRALDVRARSTELLAWDGGARSSQR